MTEIQLNNIDKVFDSEEGEIVAIDDLSLTVDDGEFLILVGPSGCGKTTTLRTIAGLEEATSGTIHFGDRDVTDLPGRERDVAMVFQNYALYPHMTVRENMSFGLRISTTMDTEVIDDRVISTAEMLGIEELLEDSPSELSGGQQQRVALGRAIVREPDVFLLDEPLSNLDAKLRAQMRTELQELQNTLDVTTVYVTHDQTEAMAMGDRIAIMSDGVLQQVGAPEEVYLAPSNEFVASFIGSPKINIFDGIVEGSIVRSDRGIEFNVSNPDLVKEHSELRFGIRPEDISIVDSGGYNATVKVVEPMGNENFVYLDVGGMEVIARVSREIRPKEDTQVQFDFVEDDVYLFDSETGATIKHKDIDSIDMQVPSD